MRRTIGWIGSFAFVLGTLGSAEAQFTQAQIPTMQVCNKTEASGRATVQINRRKGGTFTGTFIIDLPANTKVKCDPQSGYPTGTFTISGLSMTDTDPAVAAGGGINGTAFDQVTTTGGGTPPDINTSSPTMYANGRCKYGPPTAPQKICHFWLMIADNGKGLPGDTPDIVGFLIFDKAGKRIAYGTGPVISGDLTVAPTSN